MGCTCLKGLSVLHQSLDCHGVKGSGESLVRALVAYNHRKGHPIAGKVRIDIHHLCSLVNSLLLGSMGCVAFLPEEFGSAEEKPCTHFPTNNISPLVAKNRQVTPRSHPVFIGIPYNGFGGRSHNEFFFESGRRIDNHSRAVRIGHESVMGDHSTFFRKSLNVLSFTAEEGFRNEKREICILMPCFLEHLVKYTLHFFPNCISVWFDDHTSPYCGTLRQICFYYKIVIPLRVVFRPLGNLFCHFIF